MMEQLDIENVFRALHIERIGNVQVEILRYFR
jgi:hypothetical protein